MLTTESVTIKVPVGMSKYLVTRKKYPYRLKCSKEYTMSVRYGKVKRS